MDTLKQQQYSPLAMEEQVVVLYCAKNKYLTDIQFYDVPRFNAGLLSFVKEISPGILKSIRETKDLTPETEEKLRAVTDQYRSEFKPSTAQ